jgi:hypothetical protein
MLLMFSREGRTEQVIVYYDSRELQSLSKLFSYLNNGTSCYTMVREIVDGFRDTVVTTLSTELKHSGRTNGNAMVVLSFVNEIRMCIVWKRLGLYNIRQTCIAALKGTSMLLLWPWLMAGPLQLLEGCKM